MASSEIYDLCRTQDVLNEAFKVPGMTIVDTDVLAPEEASGRPGLSTGGDKHVFKAPALPRSSQLGLDRLAMEKRREKDQLDKPVVKKIKYDEDEPKQEEFKSALFDSTLNVLFVVISMTTDTIVRTSSSISTYTR